MAQVCDLKRFDSQDHWHDSRAYRTRLFLPRPKDKTQKARSPVGRFGIAGSYASYLDDKRVIQRHDIRGRYSTTIPRDSKVHSNENSRNAHK